MVRDKNTNEQLRTRDEQIAQLTAQLTSMETTNANRDELVVQLKATNESLRAQLVQATDLVGLLHRQIEQSMQVSSQATQGVMSLARTMANKRPTVPQAQRRRVLARHNDACAKCEVALDDGPSFAEIDHIIPLADGGTNVDANLQPLCLRCHREKTLEENRARQTHGP